jgi:hypothetical protein
MDKVLRKPFEEEMKKVFGRIVEKRKTESEWVKYTLVHCMKRKASESKTDRIIEMESEQGKVDFDLLGK